MWPLGMALGQCLEHMLQELQLPMGGSATEWGERRRLGWGL